MKIRTGFVSNSSSSSFIFVVAADMEESAKALLFDLLDTHFDNYKWNVEDNKLRKFTDMIEDLSSAIEHVDDDIWEVKQTKRMPNWAVNHYKTIDAYVEMQENHKKELQERMVELKEYKKKEAWCVKLCYHDSFTRNFLQYYKDQGWITLLEPSDEGEKDFTR